MDLPMRIEVENMVRARDVGEVWAWMHHYAMLAATVERFLRATQSDNEYQQKQGILRMQIELARLGQRHRPYKE